MTNWTKRREQGHDGQHVSVGRSAAAPARRGFLRRARQLPQHAPELVRRHRSLGLQHLAGRHLHRHVPASDGGAAEADRRPAARRAGPRPPRLRRLRQPASRRADRPQADGPPGGYGGRDVEFTGPATGDFRAVRPDDPAGTMVLSPAQAPRVRGRCPPARWRCPRGRGPRRTRRRRTRRTIPGTTPGSITRSSSTQSSSTRQQYAGPGGRATARGRELRRHGPRVRRPVRRAGALRRARPVRRPWLRPAGVPGPRLRRSARLRRPARLRGPRLRAGTGHGYAEQDYAGQGYSDQGYVDQGYVDQGYGAQGYADGVCGSGLLRSGLRRAGVRRAQAGVRPGSLLPFLVFGPALRQRVLPGPGLRRRLLLRPGL